MKFEYRLRHRTDGWEDKFYLESRPAGWWDKVFCGFDWKNIYTYTSQDRAEKAFERSIHKKMDVILLQAKEKT